MSSDRAAATELHLGELIAIQPRNIRGRLAPGQRLPGGQRPGRGRAQSLDFDGISPYTPGDDVRWIDWRASLRSGTVQSKRFAAESHRGRMIALDLRADLYFGVEERLMAKSSALAAAWLGWESLALQEPVGLVLPGVDPITPRRGRRHLLGLFDTICAAYAAPAPGSDPVALIELASPMMNRGDEVCLVTDAPADPISLADAARRLARMRRLTLCLIADPRLQDGPPAGRYPMRDAGGDRHTPVIRSGAAEEGQAARLKLLRDAGWEITAATDFLPRRAAA
ncbi:MAG: DUF58 domain-containing protein [Pseudomonadota bacterium]